MREGRASAQATAHLFDVKRFGRGLRLRLARGLALRLPDDAEHRLGAALRRHLVDVHVKVISADAVLGGPNVQHAARVFAAPGRATFDVVAVNSAARYTSDVA
jgi:hypothetical protein